MGRRDHFDDGHGNDDHRLSIGPEELQYLRAVSGAAQELGNWRRESARQPVNLSDTVDLKMHLIQAHDMSPDELSFYDESAHDHIPALANRTRDWSGPTVPQLDHTDLFNMHHHEHTASEYASEYPHTTMGAEHFHHD